MSNNNQVRAPETPRAVRVPQNLKRRPQKADKFDITGLKVPEGMSYEWKRVTYVGKEDREHQLGLTENHWSPVPAQRHPELSRDGGDKPIIREGLMLMERPAYLTDEARKEDRDNANKQLGDQMARLEQIDLPSGMKQTPTNVSRTYERGEPVPQDD